MRHLLLTILTFTALNTFGQVPKDTINKIKKFNIAMLTASTVVLQKGLLNSERSSNFITFYDEKGRPVENRITNLKGNKTTVYKFEYDRCGDYQKWEWLEYHDDKIDTIQIQTISFNDNCQKEKIVWIDSTDSITDVRYLTYDKMGRQTREVDKNSKNELTSFVIYSYPDSLTIDKKGFFGDSSFWYHSREYFDTKGNTLYSSSFDKKNVETADQGKTEYIYRDNQIEETLTHDLNGKVVSKTTFIYNSDGLVERTVSKSLTDVDDSETISTYRYTKRQ